MADWNARTGSIASLGRRPARWFRSGFPGWASSSRSLCIWYDTCSLVERNISLWDEETEQCVFIVFFSSWIIKMHSHIYDGFRLAKRPLSLWHRVNSAKRFRSHSISRLDWFRSNVRFDQLLPGGRKTSCSWPYCWDYRPITPCYSMPCFIFFSNIFFIRTRHAFTHLLTVIILASHQPPFLSWSVFTRFPLGTRLGPSAGDDVRFLSPR